MYVDTKNILLFSKLHSTYSLRKRVLKMCTIQTSLWFSLLLTLCAGQEENTCIEVQENLQALSEAVEALCGNSTPLSSIQPTPVQQKCECSYAVNWTSVSMTQIPCANLQHTGTVAYDIPSVIPSSAKEVLLLASARVGSSGPSNRLHYIKIYTEQNSIQYEKYLMIYSWPNKAHNTNSDNLWFPMTTGRQVFVESSVAHTGNLRFYLHAIGYR